LYFYSNSIPIMTLTLQIEPEREASEVREILNDMRGLLRLRMKRPDATAARIVGVGKLLNVFDEIERQLPANQPEGAGSDAVLAA
jgi:hypothetical protein